ncbi:glycoside hydrolase family 19 protein [Kribbella sp. CA-293567]|uniref:glycoside hydrolase family 19 protein n=1 Tax=Kribbella sp. CA-293567 TaxID=3002436 RepID=UPI0022DDB392|nr:glycoside hydrolase family 19 protein [Kribbella sp. CA-293567]WBQ08016.1 glycoside hydrolase family 19 [Kribbella sp. CA-293567]
MLKRRIRRLVTAALALAGLTAGGLVTAAPAHAAVFQTYGTGVNVRADAYLSAPVVRTLPGPTSIDVDCQKYGDLVTVSGGSSRWWAHVPALGGYVTVAYVAIPQDKLPGVAECGGTPPPPSDITLAQVQAMFGSRIANPSLVQTGLPSLNQAMRDAAINTPYRKAAFLATLVHESRLEYNIREIGDTRLYGGRGYIQLTGDFNYGPAGQYFGINLLGNPELARSLQWSAPIARWYWTQARNINPFADQLNMAKVNAAIGYPRGDGSEDQRRCVSFQNAIRVLTGSVPGGITCVRSAALSGDTSKLSTAEFNNLIKVGGGLG